MKRPGNAEVLGKVFVVVAAVAWTNSSCGAQHPLSGAFGGTPTDCSLACDRVHAKECGEKDCREVPFRIFGSSGEFTEGGLLFSTTKGTGSPSWLLPGLSYSVTSETIVITGGPLPPRTIKYHLSGDTLVTGTGTVWRPATNAFDGAVTGAASSPP